ncbi:hypothetical protein MYAER_2950 [Microcystis aeruginosa NIES-2549]|uniref:Programmed cell death toxin YdcE n=1 Tax=Microcystis aeruginosa NIES-2549 TaxID=1641812 RepID=A0A0F6RM69_MICAE|nr:hypothetical protein MYAER_2950 [Microcystis aeruginosa NIES-2549]AOC53697.1 hypothetical protein amyaer_2990 [Microcystis aeruginosa NIES-2481]
MHSSHYYLSSKIRLVYSVFQSAEVQKLWVLGKRQKARGKREEK